MTKQLIIFWFFASCFINSCTNPSTQNPSINVTVDTVINSQEQKVSLVNKAENKLADDQISEEEYNFDEPILASAYEARDDSFPSFDRADIARKLENKIAEGEALVVHIFVPLCDNEHQGIVRTSESLGNGFSLRSNLYWATSNGMKRYFKEKPSWKLLKSIKNVYGDSTVLERVVFVRDYPNQAKVYLVADAYRGDKMYETVNDFLRAISNNYREKLSLDDGTTINIHGAADLVVFNGHNGQLDLYYNQPDRWFNTSNSQKDMVVIACVASEYFEREAMRAKAYPIVRATGLLHPGAFVISAIVDDWAMLKPVEDMRLSAGLAYCKIHDCSVKTSKKLFHKGWRVQNLESKF